MERIAQGTPSGERPHLAFAETPVPFLAHPTNSDHLRDVAALALCRIEPAQAVERIDSLVRVFLLLQFGFKDLGPSDHAVAAIGALPEPHRADVVGALHGGFERRINEPGASSSRWNTEKKAAKILAEMRA